MGKDGWDNISVRDEIKIKIKQIWKEDKNKPDNQSFGNYFETVLVKIIEEHNKPDEREPFLQFIHSVDNTIILRDNFLHKPVVLTINAEKQKLHCEHHDNEDCIHVGFCFGVKKVYDVLISSGFKPLDKDNTQ